MEFGERLKALREMNGMSLDDVAKQIGLTRATIFKYENGAIANVPPERIHQLANIFHVTRPYLMGWTENPNVNPEVNLDMVAEQLRKQNNYEQSPYWASGGLETSDCITAATQAARAIIKFGISSAPVYPHKVLQQSRIATMISFSEPEELEKIIQYTKLKTFRQENGMVMSMEHTTSDGQKHYIFAVNRDDPLGKIRLALAVEMGHIYLGHERTMADSARKHREAECFALHFEFPRPLIRLLQERNFVFTRQSFAMVFGECEWCMNSILTAPPVAVSPELNRIVKEQFTPHINLLAETGLLDMPPEGEKIDLSRYMAGYEE